MDHDLYAGLDAVQEATTLKARLIMAQAWNQMQTKALGAALSHGINYQSLQTWRDLDAAMKLIDPLIVVRQVDEFVTLCRHIEKDIEAAIRRKSFRQV